MNRQPNSIGWKAFLGAALIFVVGLATYLVFPRDPPPKLLRSARQALRQREFERAADIAAKIPPGTPEYADALLISGEAETRQKRFEQAIACYRKVPADDSDAAVTATYCIGDLLWQLGEASQAEQCYRQVLAARPADVWAREQLALLLTNFGRRWEALPHLRELLRMERIAVDQLLLLGEPDAALELPANVSRCRDLAPSDPLPDIAEARAALDNHDPREAVRLARQVVETAPHQIEAWALLGRALADGPETTRAAFLSWHLRVPQPAQAHPDVWLSRGLWASQHGELEVAVRCFWEAVERFPDSRNANYHLGRTLLKLEAREPALANSFLERAERLEELRNVMNMVYRKRTDVANFAQAAEVLEALGRLSEAAAWHQAALKIDPNLASARGGLTRLTRRLSPAAPRVIEAATGAAHRDRSSFPLPDWKTLAQPPTGNGTRPETAAVADSTVQFEEAAAGIDFVHFNGSDPPQDGKLIFQNLGGGVAAIDYDCDLWPDLYFGQGAPTPDDDENHGYRDRLFRNQGDGHFIDVTLEAGLGDRRHSMGVAAGDIDNDGFPELYIANAGANRLYHNNGDGTFTDVTSAAGLTGRACTASCLIADLNDDGWPDLFDVNYLAEPEVYSLTCFREGKVRSCDPRLFAAEHDQLFLGLGDGRFDDVSESCGIRVPNGKGLGVVAADFSGSGRLDLFVANDGTGNFYFVNETTTPGDRPFFRERALETGVAFSEDGRVQASMGIAADDADGDGLIDLLVTNFYQEGSAFYHQTAPRSFEDARRRFGLRDVSLDQLGFGAQFIDGELDGDPDLIVTNGHIEDFSDRGKPYRMRPQYFRNVAGRRFEELSSESLGPFFQGAYLGRSLARLDWNRDGSEEVVISHMGAPAVLLTNTTRPTGHFLALSLVATAGARDAVGTRVECTLAGRVRHRQLAAGDGYMASNERRLVFGLGERDVVDTLTIRWPSGCEHTFTQVAADRHLIAIEGRPVLLRLPAAAATPRVTAGD